MVRSIVETEPACCKPPVVVDVCISTGERGGFSASAPSSTRTSSLPSVTAEGSMNFLSPKLAWLIGLLTRTDEIYPYQVSLIWCDALLTAVSLVVLFYICLRGETCLPSLKLQSCETLIYMSRIFPKFFEVPVRSIESLF